MELNYPKTDIYLHIGLPKTATTSLQMYFFNRLDTYVDYLGVKQPRLVMQNQLYDLINKAVNSGLFDENLCSDIRERLKDYIDMIQKPVFLSDEMFTVDYDGVSWQQKLERLGKMLKDFNVVLLVTVREPIKATYSLYVELYHQVHKEFPLFLDFFQHSNQAKIYRYDRLHSELMCNFHTARIKYLAFENLIKQVDARSFIDEIHHLGESFFMCIPNSNEKRRSGQGVLSKGLSIGDLTSFLPRSITRSIIRRLLKPMLDLNLPFTKRNIPYYDSSEEKFMKLQLTSSNSFLEKFSTIKY